MDEVKRLFAKLWLESDLDGTVELPGSGKLKLTSAITYIGFKDDLLRLVSIIIESVLCIDNYAVNILDHVVHAGTAILFSIAKITIQLEAYGPSVVPHLVLLLLAFVQPRLFELIPLVISVYSKSKGSLVSE